MNERDLMAMVFKWGRWASVRQREPRGSAFSLEGRYLSPQVWWPDPPRMPGMTASDHEDARLTESVILTMRKPEIGALCRRYAGMDARTARKVWALRAENYERVLPEAEFNVLDRLQVAIAAGILMSELSPQITFARLPADSSGQSVAETFESLT